MPIIDNDNSGYKINGVDIANNATSSTTAGFVTKEYLIDVYPGLYRTLTTAGLWAWGGNAIGELGDAGLFPGHKSSPILVQAAGLDWESIDSGASDSAVGVRKDGSMWLWGSNRMGKLGNNNTSGQNSPVQTIAAGTDWKQAATGYDCSAAIKDAGTLWTWGNNQYGQLGSNSTVHRSSPAQTIAAGSNWKRVSVGTGFMGAVKTDGTLWMWGFNNRGQLGDNTNAHRSSPVQTVASGTNWKMVSCGAYHAAGIKHDGSLWLWGHNSHGQIGDGTTTMRSSPVQTVAGGSNWVLVSCGDYHTAAIKADGTLWMWGSNSQGQLGDNTATNKSSPVQTITGGTNWKLVSCGSYHTVALKIDGTVWGWGRNHLGQLGDNTTTNRSSPVQTVDGGTNWKRVAAGTEATYGIRDDSDFPV